MRNNNIKSRTLYFAAALVLFLLTIPFSADIKTAVAASLKNCAEQIIPPLFPALILTSFMTSAGAPDIIKKRFSAVLKKTYGLPESCTEAVIFGSAAGYPAGVKTAVQLYKNGTITRETAHRTALLTVNPGIIFTVSVVGKIGFGTAKTGFLLYLSVLAGQTATALLTKKQAVFHKNETNRNLPAFDFPTALTSAVSYTVNACVSMASWITAFAAMSVFVNTFTLHLHFESIRIFTEITDAVSYSLYKNSPSMCAFALAFGGICIFCQLLPDLNLLGIKAGEYFFYRFITAGISMIIAVLLFHIFPSDNAVSVFAPFGTASLSSGASGVLSLLFLCIIFMFSIANRYGIC